MAKASRNKTIPIDCANCPLRHYASLTPALVSGLKLIQQARLGARVLPPGTQICSEDDVSAEVFTLFAGWACRYKLLHDGRRQILDFRLPGDIFGHGYEGPQGLDHSVESITHVVLCVFRKAQFETAVQSDPALADLVRRVAQVEERTAFEHLMDVGRRNAIEAVGHLLLELYMRAGQGGLLTEHGCEFPLTQQHLADALGLTAVHVNRILRRLREGGLASISNHVLTIHDLNRLIELCEFDKDYIMRMPVI